MEARTHTHNRDKRENDRKISSLERNDFDHFCSLVLKWSRKKTYLEWLRYTFRVSSTKIHATWNLARFLYNTSQSWINSHSLSVVNCFFSSFEIISRIHTSLASRSNFFFRLFNEIRFYFNPYYTVSQILPQKQKEEYGARVHYLLTLSLKH